MAAKLAQVRGVFRIQEGALVRYNYNRWHAKKKKKKVSGGNPQAFGATGILNPTNSWKGSLRIGVPCRTKYHLPVNSDGRNWAIKSISKVLVKKRPFL